MVEKEEAEIYFYYQGVPITQDNITEYGALVSAVSELALMYKEDLEDEKFSKEDLLSFTKDPNENLQIKKKILGKGQARQFIDSKINISGVAKTYGLKVKKNRTKCIFHGGSNPTSLFLDDSRNCFYCFSCAAKGDIIEFIRRLEDGGYKTRSN
jgi:hypothetical protein